MSKVVKLGDLDVMVADNVVIEVRRAKDEKLLDRIESHNLVVNLGLNSIADILVNGTVNRLWIDKFLFGTGTAVPVAADTALKTKVFEDIVTRRTVNPTSAQFVYYMSSTAANGNTLTEAGLWTKSGELFARATHTGIAKNSTIVLTYTWDIALNPA